MILHRYDACRLIIRPHVRLFRMLLHGAHMLNSLHIFHVLNEALLFE